MGEQVEKRFTWVLKKFSTLQDPCYYSRPFTFAGWNWHIIAYPEDKGNDGPDKHLSLYLGLIDPQSLPLGWRREIKFRLTVVNKKYYNSTKVLDGQAWYDASHHSWGFKEVLPVFKIRCREEGFLVGDKLIVVAKLHVFPVVVAPEETVEFIEPVSSKEGNLAVDASVDRTQGDSLVQKTENVASHDNAESDISEKNSCVETSHEDLDDDDASDEEGSDVDDDDDDDNASEEGSDDDGASEVGSDDDDASEEGSDDNDGSEEGSDDDDASSLVSDDGGKEEQFLNTVKAKSLIVGNCGTECSTVASETEVSNVDNDDAPREDPDDDDAFEDDDASSLVSSVSDKDVSSLDKRNSTVDTSQKVETGDTRCNNVAFVTEASNEIQPVKETMDVNGFQVFSSECGLCCSCWQIESVRHIFKRHPDIALGFRPKNQQIRTVYMNELCSLIVMLCQSPEKLSEDDLRNADDTLVDLIDVGFQLNWLKIKLNEVSEKKKIVQGSEARLKTMDEQLQKLKVMFLSLESQLQKEKAEHVSARAPLSFSDVVS